MNILITICGRAGSKGVKNKNIRKFMGSPLVNYTIGAALLFKESRPKDNIDICINSDSEELLTIASLNNVVGIQRPEELATDSAPKVPVIKHSLEFMENKLLKRYKYIIDLDITSPLRKIEDIENSLNKLIDNKDIDVVFSVVNSRRNPYFNMIEVIDEQVKKVKESNYVTRQQAPCVYDMNASIYSYRRNSLLKRLRHSPFDGECGISLMKDTAILDVDSEKDFELMTVLGEYFIENEFKELKDYITKIEASV